MGRIEQMRKAREGAHTYFLLYLNLRSRVGPNRLIYVVEGREDIPVYDIWLARELGDEPVEPLQVKGKGNVIHLSRLLNGSESIRSEKVILCIDHDFDGTRGSTLSDNTYVTTAYSIENLLVSEESIDRLLIRALNATGEEQPARAGIVMRFAERYTEFNRAMLYPNAHARFARLCSVECPGLPDSIEPAIRVELDRIEMNFDTDDSQECVRFLRLGATPLPAELAVHLEHLGQSDLRITGRGKFILDFVRRFVSLVFEDRRAAVPRLFVAQSKALPDPCHNLLVNLANAAPTAQCFRTFIQEQQERWRAVGLSAPALI